MWGWREGRQNELSVETGLDVARDAEKEGFYRGEARPRTNV